MRSIPLTTRSAQRIRTHRALAACIALIGLGCSPSPDAGDATRSLVAVSAPPLAWFVEALAADAVDVVSLLPAGASPTSFEPGIATLRTVEDARLVVAVGHPSFPFEQAWFGDLLRDRPELPVVRGPASADDSGDPHWWLSPAAASAFVEPLAAALTSVLPDRAEEVAANARRLREDIASLDGEIAELLGAAGGRRFLVFHPAWGHFARHYELEQIAIEADGKAPDAHRLGELIQKARTAAFRHVIVQPQIDPAHARSVADAIGASVVTFDPLARSWDENLRAVARSLAAGVLVP